MTIRMIASDLDGTLIRSDGTISDRSRATLAAAEDAGWLVVFATGRPPRWMAPVVDATGHRGLAVCANGGILYDLHTEQIVETFPLDAEVSRLLAKALREALPEVRFAIERDLQFGHEPGYVPRFELPPEVLVAELDELLAEPIVKLLARHDEMTAEEMYAAAAEVVGELASLATVTFSDTDGLLEVSAAGVSKAFALERVAGEHAIDATEVVAFGDMPNDLPMLAWAGHAVAVVGAHPEVLALADEVALSNDDDGVAVVIERLLDEAKA